MFCTKQSTVSLQCSESTCALLPACFELIKRTRLHATCLSSLTTTRNKTKRRWHIILAADLNKVCFANSAHWNGALRCTVSRTCSLLWSLHTWTCTIDSVIWSRKFNELFSIWTNYFWLSNGPKTAGVQGVGLKSGDAERELCVVSKCCQIGNGVSYHRPADPLTGWRCCCSRFLSRARTHTHTHSRNDFVCCFVEQSPWQ